MRRLLLDVAPFRVSPPIVGAHHAVYYADEALSRYWNVFLFTTGVRKDTLKFLPRAQEIVINPHFKEYSYATPSILPLTLLTRQGAGIPQIYAGRYLSWKRPSVLLDKVRECDVIQVELPWQVGYMRKINSSGKPLVFVAHNVESGLWEKMNSNGKRFSFKSWAMKEISRQEIDAFQSADAVIAVSETDRERIIRDYGVKEEMVFLIPWGVDIKKYRVPSEDERIEAKKNLGLLNKKVAVFSGALYGPNVEAVRFILDLAKDFGSDTVFLIVGRVGEAFKGVSSNNVMFTGFVDNPVRYFTAADVAINPMSSGGGMHLKMLEYLASGLPVVTTEFGARGLRSPWENYLIISELKGFVVRLRGALEDSSLWKYYCMKGREVVVEFYSWNKVAQERIKVYEMLLK